MAGSRHSVTALARLAAVAAALVFGASAAESWPDRPWLLLSLIHEVPALLKAQDPETGRFGSKPWVCTDQNAIFPLAVAWATEDPANPYYRAGDVLRAVCRGGDVLLKEQDPRGMWTFRGKDNSTWGQIHMPWTYSRWIRTYALVHDAMPVATRGAWEKGLQLGFRGIRRNMDGPTQNITAHNAMALFLAGQSFGNEDWQEAARRFLEKVVAVQDAAGFWSENCGPVVSHNMVYMEALGIYYKASGDASVLPALERGARFHVDMLWPDGTPIATVDERQAYHRERSLGNVGFSHTPVGRGFLIAQTRPLREEHRDVSADFAASMLCHGGQGEGENLPIQDDQRHSVLGDNKALVLRRDPWQICFSAYCCPVPRSRWIQDRQNLVDVFLDGLGVVIGGGNTKLQPYWSTFTVGDPGEVRHRPGDANPDFAPHTETRWVPTRSALNPDRTAPSLELTYHDHIGRVGAEFLESGELRLTYEAVGAVRQHFEAHVPFLRRQGRIRFASGLSVYLTEEPVVLRAAQTGAWFEWDGLRAEVPVGATLTWPARQHNPYAKDGAAPLANAKLVMILPFSAEQRRHTLTLCRVHGDPPRGRVYEARQLPVMSKTGTRLQPLDDLGSVLLAATRPGDSMTFTLAVEATGTYELLADFVLFPRYGIAQVLVDGTPAGTPFDAYAPELDVSGPVSMGEVLLTAGKHEVGVTIAGRNALAAGYLVSIRTFHLRPVEATGLQTTPGPGDHRP